MTPLLFLFFTLMNLPFVTLANTDSSPLSSDKKFVVIIDPGHGGSDNGAVYSGVREADIALKVSLLLKAELQKQSHIEAVLTRDSDSTLSLQERVEKSQEQGAQLFVSLHANASPDLRAKGVEFYFQNRLATEEESLYLAHLENQMTQVESEDLKNSVDSTVDKKSDLLAILEDLKRQTKIRRSFAASESLSQAWQRIEKKGHHPLRQAPFYVLAKNNVPAVLVEVGFLSNPKEAQKLMDPNFQLKAARQLAQGVLKFKEKMDKGQSSRLQ